MTQILKGFVEIDSLQDLTPGVTAPLGELSLWSMTYTKDKSEFSHTDFPGYRLTVFNFTDSSGNILTPTEAFVKEISQIVQYAMNYTALNMMPYDVSNFEATMVADAVNNATSLLIGPLYSNNQIALPEWISWNSIAQAGVSVKIWLCDTAFRNQYDLFDITPVAPLSNLDDFFKTPNQVKTALGNVTVSQMMDAIQLAKAGNPETYIRTISFNYISPVLGADPIPTNWSVLIYGLQGDNVDAIKEYLQNYILTNSTHGRADWETIFPDIFKNTEFTILPRWDKMAIEDLAVQTGIYGSITDPKESITYAKNNISYYTQEWIDDNVEVIPFPYRYISLVIVGGPNNTIGSQHFKEIFSDYIPAGTTSLEFNRMVSKTQQWMLYIEQMLLIAENLDSYLTIPDPIRVIKRDGVKCLSLYYEEVEYLVALKDTTPNVN